MYKNSTQNVHWMIYILSFFKVYTPLMQGMQNFTVKWSEFITNKSMSNTLFNNKNKQNIKTNKIEQQVKNQRKRKQRYILSNGRYNQNHPKKSWPRIIDSFSYFFLQNKVTSLKLSMIGRKRRDQNCKICIPIITLPE